MDLIVVCEFEDLRQEVVRADFVDISDAVACALALADKMGRQAADEPDPAHLVHVIEDKRTELTVRVFRDRISDVKAR